ncbi:MAG: Flp family type IVb pilin, partial [Pseudomonadota bacterium]
MPSAFRQAALRAAAAFARDERGATLIEYTLLMSLISIVAVNVFQSMFETGIEATLLNISAAFDEADINGEAAGAEGAGGA